MTPGDYARFDWDTGRRVHEPRRAPEGAAPRWVKVFLWTLGILIGVPAILAAIGGLYCWFLLNSAS